MSTVNHRETALDWLVREVEGRIYVVLVNELDMYDTGTVPDKFRLAKRITNALVEGNFIRFKRGKAKV